MFKKTIGEYKVKKSHIWNINKKGFLLEILAKCKVVYRKGRKSPKYVQNGNRELITVLECVSLIGVVLPTIIVIKGANHYMCMYIKGQKDSEWIYAYSPKGWTSNELGLAWLEYYYEPKTCPE